LQSLYPYGTFTVPSPSLFGEGRGGAVAYLTFDDGPIPEVTPKVLEILDRYGVKGTFFMVGENIDKHPEVFGQVLKGGHAIANHTYNHLKGWRCSLKDYMANVAKCREAIERHSINIKSSNLKSSNLKLFRPPYGKTWIWQRRALLKAGYTVYLWDILTRDYAKTRTPEAMLAQIQRETRPGSIINFHDSLKSNERMLEVLPKAIEWLQGEGYELKTLNEE